MKIHGYVVVIMRTGEDGTPFPLTNTICTIGRNQDCDIRVHLSTVSRLHCKIDVDSKGKGFLTNLSQVSPTILNKIPMATNEINVLEHMDIITVEEREFRWEYPEGSVFASSTRNDQLIYKILSPTTKSPISHHNVNSDSSGMKRKGFEASLQELPDSKRKRVSFGPQLHPEHFDKLLPPDTPISKGEKPNTLTLLNTSESPHSVARKSKRTSLPPLNIAIAEESGTDTPTKSLLRRRSPTPVKPYIARSLGLLVPKALNDGSPNAQNYKDDLPKQKVCSDHKPLTRRSFDAVPDINDSPKMAHGKAKEASPKLPSSKSCQASVNSSPTSSSKTKVINQASSSKSLKTPDKMVSQYELTINSETLTAFPITRKNGVSESSPKKVAFRNSLRNFDISKSFQQVATSGSSHMREIESKVAFSNVELHKTNPRRVESPEAITNRADLPTRRSESPKATPKRSESPKATPKRSESPKATPKRSESPKATPRRSESPKATPRRSESPKATPRRSESPKATPRRSESPKATPRRSESPKATPRRSESPKATPRRSESPKATPRRSESPKATRRRSESSKATRRRSESPKATPRRSESPKATPRRSESPKTTPRRSESPKTTPKRSESPKATPKRSESPKATPKRSESPKATPKMSESPKATPKRSESPKATPKRSESPKATPKRSESPKATPKRSESPKATPVRSPSPKVTPERSPSPKATPERSQSPKATPKRSPSPKAIPEMSPLPKAIPEKSPSPKVTPKRSLSPKVTPKGTQSPKAASKRSPSPRATPKRSPSPKATPKRSPSPRATPRRADSPKAAPRRADSPKAAPRRADSPKAAPRRADSPKAAPRRADSPKAAPRRADSPKAAPRRADSPKAAPRRADSPKAAPRRADSPKAAPRRADSPKAAPRRADSPKAAPRRADSPKAAPRSADSPKAAPRRADSPKAAPRRADSPKAAPRRADSPKATPRRADSPKATPRRADSPKATPRRADSPKATPRRADSPKATPRRADSPKATPRRADSPKTTPRRADSPKATPRRADLPKATSKRADLPKATPRRADSPKATPRRADSPKATPRRADSPKATPRRADSPKATPRRADSPKATPRRADSPKATPRRADSPKATPRRADSPKATPRRADSPKATPRRADSPKATPRRADSPKATPRRADSPKATPRRADSPKATHRRADSPKATPWRPVSPKATPRRPQSPKATPRKADSLKDTIEKVGSPRGTPPKLELLKAASRRERSPKATPKKVLSSKVSSLKLSRKEVSASSPRKVASPPSSHKKVATPPSSPKTVATPPSSPKTVATPPSSPKKVASPPSSPKKVASPPSSPKKVASPPSSPKKVASPPSSPKKVASPPSSPNMVASPPSPRKMELSTLSPIKMALLPASPRVLSTLSERELASTTNMKSELHVSYKKGELNATSPKKSESSVSSSKKRTSLRVHLQHIILPKNAKRTLQQSPISSRNSSLSKSPRGTKRGASLTPRPHVLKRLKAGASTPDSVQKTKTPSRKTPAKILKTPKKSWADILKNGLMANGVPCSRIRHSSQVLRRARSVRANRRSAFKSKVPMTMFSKEVPKKFEFGQGTTGHANSPASIFIHKKTSKASRVFRKGRKSPLKAVFARSSPGKYDNLEGLEGLLATPKANRRDGENSPVRANSSIKEQYTPQSTSRKLGSKTPSPMKTPSGPSNEELMESLGASPALFSPATPSSSKSVRHSIGNRPSSQIGYSASFINMTNFDFSSIKTPEITEDNFISPLMTPAASSKTPEHMIRSSSGKSCMASPEDIPLETDATTFDFENAHTPDVSQVDFVSPVSTRSKNSSPKITDTSRNLPKSKYDNVAGRKSLLSTPQPIRQFRKSSQTELHEMKILLHSPRVVASTPKVGYDVAGVTSIRKTSLKGDDNGKFNIPGEVQVNIFGDEITGLEGIAMPLVDSIEPDDRGMQLRTREQTPKSPRSDDNFGMRSKQTLDTSIAENPKGDYTDGVKLMRSPKTASSDCNNPNNIDSVNIIKMLQHQEPVQDYPKADYTDVRGVGKLMKTPKAAVSVDYADESHIIAIRRILRTPKPVSDSPKADYSKVAGVKKLLKTPNVSTQSSPKADYTDVRGIKKLMKTPKAAAPDDDADATHITAIREMLCTPKPAQDSPNADYSDVASLKNQIKIPIATNLGPNIEEYGNIAEINRLCRSPKHVTTKIDSAPVGSNIQGLQKLFRTPRRNPENKEIITKYCEPKGLKKLLATPKRKKCSPFSDYTNVAGIKKLLSTPHTPFNSPEADYTNVRGLRALMRTPKVKDNSLEIDLEGLSQLMATPLSDHTNKVVKKIVELVQHSSTPESVRKLHSSLKVSPAASSPSENIPPVEGISNHTENGDGTPRRSQRNARAEEPEVTEPVRRGRSRKGAEKETVIFQSHAVVCALEQTESSPVVPERNLRSRRNVVTIDKQMLNKKKSRKGKMTSDEKFHNSSIKNKSFEASPLVVENKIDAKSLETTDRVETTQERQTVFSPESNTPREVNSHTSNTEDSVPDTLPVRRRRNQKQAELEVPIASQGKRRKQTKMNVAEVVCKTSTPVLEDSVSSVPSGKTKEDKCKSTPVRRGRGRKVIETNYSITNNSSKTDLSKHTDELKINSVTSVEIIDITPSRTRKTRAQHLLNGVQDKPEVYSEIQEDRASVVKPKESCNLEENTQTSSSVRRGRGRKKVIETGGSSTNNSSKKVQSKHTDVLKINPLASVENIDLAPSRTRKTRAQHSLNNVQDMPEVYSKVQDEDSMKRSSRPQKKKESEIKPPITKGRKTIGKMAVTVQDVNQNASEEQAVRITRRGRTRVEDIPEVSVPATRRKKGDVRLEYKIKQETAAVESAEQSIYTSDNYRVEQKLDCHTLAKSKKNEGKLLKKIVEHEVIEHKTRSTRNKDSEVSLEVSTQKRKADSAVEGMTRRTRARK